MRLVSRRLRDVGFGMVVIVMLLGSVVRDMFVSCELRNMVLLKFSVVVLVVSVVKLMCSSMLLLVVFVIGLVSV